MIHKNIGQMKWCWQNTHFWFVKCIQPTQLSKCALYVFANWSRFLFQLLTVYLSKSKRVVLSNALNHFGFYVRVWGRLIWDSKSINIVRVNVHSSHGIQFLKIFKVKHMKHVVGSVTKTENLVHGIHIVLSVIYFSVFISSFFKLPTDRPTNLMC